MPIYEADKIHQLLRNEKENILNCLADWILTHFKTKEERNAFIGKMHKRRIGPGGIYQQQADLFVKDLRERILRVWAEGKNTN